MSQTLFRTRTLAVAISAAITCSAGAADWPAYEIVNIDDLFSVKGTLDNTRNGYGMAVAGEAVLGAAKGVNDGDSSNLDDDDDNVIDEVIDAILPEQEINSNNVYRPFIGNDFLFEQQVGDDWVPNYVALLEDKPPVLNPQDDEDNAPRTSSTYFGANALGLRVGATSALPADPLVNENCDREEDEDCSEFLYYREFENRAFVQSDNGIALLAPPITEYVTDNDELDPTPVNVGGVSVATDVNENGLVTGYATVEIVDSSFDELNSCIENASEEVEEGGIVPLPLDICVQDYQNNGRIFYKTRAYLWQVDPSNLDEIGNGVELPLAFEQEEDDERTYLTQALASSDTSDTYVVGRGNQLNSDGDLLSNLYAQAWIGGGDSYEVHPIGPTRENNERIIESIAYDVNDNGIAVGVVRRYIDGYERYKFGFVDLKQAGDDEVDLTFTEARDFFNGQSDLSSRGRAINDAGIVVGNIEVDRTRQLPRQVRGFAYNTNCALGTIECDTNRDNDSNVLDDEFVNLNHLLTCDSRGYVPAQDGDRNVEEDRDGNLWRRYTVEDSENFATPITYEVDIAVVDANDIAEDGTIVGTALVALPRVQTEIIETEDDEGNAIFTEVVKVDEEGRPFIETDADGNPTTNQVPRAVVLKPVDAVNQCTLEIDDGLNPEPNERQGASLGWGWLLGLVSLAGWRRRR